MQNHFFVGYSWFKLNNMRLALGMSLKFYNNVAKGLKLKFRKFLGLIPTFIEVTGEKQAGGINVKVFNMITIMNEAKTMVKQW